MSQFSYSAFRREARANLVLALPLIAAQVSFVSMGTVDTIVAGRMGESELAAVAVASNVWFFFFVLFMGLFMACSPIVAQRVGGNRPALETGAFVRGAALLSLGFGLIWMLLVRLLLDPVLDLLGLQTETRGYAHDYLVIVSWSAVPFCIGFVARNAAEGYGLTKVALMAGLTGFLVNAIFACLLGFGWFGFPRMGVAGCALATVLAAIAMLLVYGWAYWRLPVLRALQVFRRGSLWPEPAMRRQVLEVIHLGGPIAAILTAEAWLFLGGALLMARFGDAVVAAHQVAINFASLTFMVPMSVGMATAVRVGHAVGAGAMHEVRLRGQSGMILGMIFALLSASLMALLPRMIVDVYTDVASVAEMAVGFLYFAALFQLFDCIQATANGALRGLKDTRIPMLITVSAYWVVGMPVAAWLAFGTTVGPNGIWCGFIAGLGVAAAGLSLRFLNKSARLTATKGSVVMP